MKKVVGKVCAGLTAAILCFTGTVVLQDVFMEPQNVYAAPAYNGESLSYGMTSDAVAYVQQLLANLGYGVYVDGYYGEQTENVVISFQYDYGLYVDGVAGPITVEYLQSLLGVPTGSSASQPAQQQSASSSSASSDSLYIGSYGDQVKKVQQALSNLGYSIVVDGDYGYQTADVVAQYQQNNGLYVDGVAGPITQAAIFSQNGGSAPSTTQTQQQPASTSGSTNTDFYLVYGDNNSNVSKVQQALLDLGYNVGIVDGYFGNMTYNAVVAFQQANGLYVDVEVGPITAKALFGVSASSAASAPAASTEGLSEVQKAARAVLDRVGWDLYAAFEWSVGANYNINQFTGNTTSQAALSVFQNYYSDCVGMASSFCWMARELGYQAYVIDGQVPYRRGGYGEHAWVEIVVGGSTYVCDPDFEMQTGMNGYMINYGQSGTWQYVYGYVMGD